jgi:hypothetical protein
MTLDCTIIILMFELIMTFLSLLALAFTFWLEDW